MSVSDFIYIYNNKNGIYHDKYAEKSEISTENRGNWRNAQKN